MLKNQTWNEIVKLWWIFFSKVKTEMHTYFIAVLSFVVLDHGRGIYTIYCIYYVN